MSLVRTYRLIIGTGLVVFGIRGALRLSPTSAPLAISRDSFAEVSSEGEGRCGLLRGSVAGGVSLQSERKLLSASVGTLFLAAAQAFPFSSSVE